MFIGNVTPSNSDYLHGEINLLDMNENMLLCKLTQALKECSK